MARSSSSTTRGVSHFSDLQQALSDHAGERLTFFAFDLMYLDGYDLTKVPLLERKALLRALLAPVAGRQLGDPVLRSCRRRWRGALRPGDRDGARGHRLEARRCALYRGPLEDLDQGQVVQVGDFPDRRLHRVAGRRRASAPWRSAQWVDGELEYRGKCGTGFSGAELHSINDKLQPLADGGQKLAGMTKDVIPVRPVITAHVHYANITADNSLRHAVFKGLREPEITRASEAPIKRKRIISDADLANIWVTNPTRRLFGKSGPTKLDVAIYYAQVGDFMLPHIFGRPVSLVRSPSRASSTTSSSSAIPSPACRRPSAASRR